MEGTVVGPDILAAAQAEQLPVLLPPPTLPQFLADRQALHDLVVGLAPMPVVLLRGGGLRLAQQSRQGLAALPLAEENC